MENQSLLLPDGNFAFRSRANVRGERTLFLRYYLQGEPALVSTKISIPEQDWDQKRQKVKPRNPEHERFNNRLRKFKAEVNQRIEAYDSPLTPGSLKRLLDGTVETKADVEEKEKSRDFIQYARNYNQTCYDLERITYSTYNNDNYNIEMFHKYITETTGESVLPFSEITPEVFDAFKKYCLKIGNQKQSINKKLKPLFKAVDYAAKNDLISSKIATNISSGYFNLKNRKYESELDEQEVHYLTQEQLQELVNLYDIVKYDRTRDYIELFMFSYHACGMKFSDLLTLEWDHIDWANKEIKKNLFKGKVGHNIPLVDRAVHILRLWKDKNYNPRFVFDLLPASFDLNDVAILDNQRKSKNRSLQTSLNELGRKLPSAIPFNLSIHVARHSWAVAALNRGVSLHRISQLMGHSSIMTTEKVYAKFLPNTLAEDVHTLMNDSFATADQNFSL
jgi:integrase